MKTKDKLMLIALLILPQGALADIYEYGLGLSYGQYSVNDPDGPTDVAFTQAVSGQWIVTSRKHWRWWIDAQYVNFDLDYTPGNIGQAVRSFHIDAVYQRGFRLPMYLDGWIGAGLGMGINKMTNRALVDDQGFITQSFDDRDETNYSIITNAGFAFGGKDARMTLNARYTIALDNDVETMNTGFFIVFTYD
ncbi:MAG: hypothetical protein OEY58_19540 [Gammaproteobacteria bacterium]|nr:hypothetical protein [Gammaproteobacteria bacterium]